MEQNILLSKITASPTDTTWSQAYSTLHLYIVVSLAGETVEKSIATIGKEFLERLQREFFALEEKKLSLIKEAVENSLRVIPPHVGYSLVLSTVVGDIAYCVIAESGQVVLRRNQQFHHIGSGISGQITGFSGKLKHGDILIFGTYEFSQKIPLDTLSSIQHINGVLDLSEDLAPKIHEQSSGTEAALFLQYQNFVQRESLLHKDEAKINEESYSSAHQTSYEKQSLQEDKPLHHIKLPFKPHLSLPHILSPKLFFRKRFMILVLIVIVGTVLGIRIVKEQQARTQQQKNQVLKQTLKPAEQKYTEGVELLPLNQALALEDLHEAENMLKQQESQFSKGSPLYDEYQTLLSNIQNKIAEYEKGVSVTDVKTILESNKNKLATLTAVTRKGGQLLVSDTSGNIVAIDENGAIQTTFAINIKSVQKITATASFIYILNSEGIYQIDKKSKTNKKIVTETLLDSIDTFGSNIYALNTHENTIHKYSGSTFGKSSYFASKQPLNNSITDFSIDSSIWIIDSTGTIHKFLKGTEETFTVKNLPSPIGKNSLVYTEEGMSSLYILDRINKKLIVLDKNGSYTSQYEWSGIGNATSFAVNETERAVYVTSQNTLYSFHIQ